MKPSVLPETVFGKAKPASERLRRALDTGTMVLDMLTASPHQKDVHFERSRKKLHAAESAIHANSNALRDKFALDKKTAGMFFQAPTTEGGSIAAVAVAHDDKYSEKTFWDIQVVSASGRKSQFTTDNKTIYRGSAGEHEYPPQVTIVNPENGKHYSGNNNPDATLSVAMAISRLNQADIEGVLVTAEMPEGILSQQSPDLLAA